MSLLEFADVRYRYADGSVGLDGCSLAIRAGTRNALIGANGSGKTTLFQHANGLFRPQSGAVRFVGREIDYGRAGLRELRSKVGLVFQNPDRQLFSASVREDVSFGPCNLGLDDTTVRRRVADALEAVGMSAFADKAVHNLSFGQKKRVCIAGVLAMEPELLVLDEPMAGLDYAMREDLIAVLDGLHARGMTLLLATHDIDFAYRWADRVHLMAAGRCVASFDGDDLPQRVADLAAVRLPAPAVVPLLQHLATLGVRLDGRPPRTAQELAARLDQLAKSGVSPESKPLSKEAVCR